MKKTLFLMLTLIAALGLATNNVYSAKQATSNPVQTVVAEEADVAPAKSDCTECCGSAQCTSWFDQAKAWFLGLFKTTEPVKAAQKAPTKARSTLKDCNDDCIDDAACEEDDETQTAK